MLVGTRPTARKGHYNLLHPGLMLRHDVIVCSGAQIPPLVRNYTPPPTKNKKYIEEKINLFGSRPITRKGHYNLLHTGLMLRHDVIVCSGAQIPPLVRNYTPPPTKNKKIYRRKNKSFGSSISTSNTTH